MLKKNKLFKMNMKNMCLTLLQKEKQQMIQQHQLWMVDMKNKSLDLKIVELTMLFT